MKFLVIAFLLFLFFLVLFLVNSYTGFFTEVQTPVDKTEEEWYSIGKIEILNGRIVNITKRIS